jgi:hypothetical protein
MTQEIGSRIPLVLFVEASFFADTINASYNHESRPFSLADQGISPSNLY